MGGCAMTILVVLAFIFCWPLGVILLLYFLLSGVSNKK